MKVELLHIAPIELIVSGIRMCYDSGDKSDSRWTDDEWHPCENVFILGPKDKALIERIIKSGHHSTLEHICLTLDIDGISRALLQELSRHRIGVSPSVKSTRYTLKELKDEKCMDFIEEDYHRAAKYVVFTGELEIDRQIFNALDNARFLVAEGYPNDKIKYCIPDAYKTSGQYTLNIRSLRALLTLRTSPRALKEFQDLCKEIVKVIPEEYLFLIQDCIFKETNEKIS